MFNINYLESKMATVKLILEKKRVLKNGTYPLVFRIIHKRNKRMISTPFRVYEDEYDAVLQKVVQHSMEDIDEVTKINQELDKIKQRIEVSIARLEDHLVDYDVEQIVAAFKLNDRDFITHIDELIEQRILMERYGTARAYRSTKSTLIKFTQRASIDICAIDALWVRSYEMYLKNSGVTDNTINFYMRNFKSMYNQISIMCACEVESNPFKGSNRRLVKTIKRAIPKDLITKIKNLDGKYLNALQILSRDIFMFSFYTRGMPLVDVVHLKSTDIQCGELRYTRKKTQQQLRVKLVQEAQQIMKKYENDSEYVFPIITTNDQMQAYNQYTIFVERINRHLKQIGKIIEVNIPLTTYVARHSWATLAKNIGVPTSVISESLGHTSEKMTQIYLKEFENEVIDEVNSEIANMI